MNYTTEHLIEALTRTLSTYGMNVVGAILTLIAGFALSGWLARLVTRAWWPCWARPGWRSASRCRAR